jgi:hypothetical protein
MCRVGGAGIGRKTDSDEEEESCLGCGTDRHAFRKQLVPERAGREEPIAS